MHSGIKEPTYGYRNCNTSHGYVKVRELFFTWVIIRVYAVSNYTFDVRTILPKFEARFEGPRMVCICTDQLLALKNHNNFTLRNKITKKIAILLISIFLHKKKLQHLILLQFWCIISLVISYGCLYSIWCDVWLGKTQALYEANLSLLVFNKCYGICARCVWHMIVKTSLR